VYIGISVDSDTSPLMERLVVERLSCYITQRGVVLPGCVVFTTVVTVVHYCGIWEGWANPSEGVRILTGVRNLTLLPIV